MPGFEPTSKIKKYVTINKRIKNKKNKRDLVSCNGQLTNTASLASHRVTELREKLVGP